MDLTELKDKSVADLTAEELEFLVSAKQNEKRKEDQKKRKSYEETRNSLVTQMVQIAQEMQNSMIAAKSEMMETLEGFKETAVEYSDISKKSKGGFSLRNSDNTLMVRYERNVKSDYDERAKQAEQLVKDFLADTVKKRDKGSYELIVGLLEKNNKGDYSPQLIAKLLTHENNFEDKRWTKAMTLFKESYIEVEISNSLSFYVKDDNGKDQQLKLNFATLPIN